jgi:tetratricopeptide (TPR) repeat protein
LTYLGRVRLLTGDVVWAGEAISRALEIFRATGTRSNEAWALNHYAATVAAGGDLSRALDLYRRALDMNRELNKPDDQAIALEGLGECQLSAGDTEPAAGHLREALEVYQRLGMTPDVERVRGRLTGLFGR